MLVVRSESIPVCTDQDVVISRQAVRKACQELGFSLVDQTKMVTAASELARNTVVYGGGGFMLMEIVQSGARDGVRLRFEDRGPGIPDMDLALRDGWSSGSGLGLGLSGARRLVNDFEIESTPGEGTKVTVTRWK